MMMVNVMVNDDSEWTSYHGAIPNWMVHFMEHPSRQVDDLEVPP